MYTITVTENQARIIAKACDILARIHIGQVECVADEFMTRDDYLDLYEKFKDIHATITGSRNGGPSISNSTVHEDGKTAWDICQIIKHRLLHNNSHPESDQTAKHNVYYNEPLQCGKENLPTMNYSETLYEFRQKYPFKPYEIALLKPPTDQSVRAQLVRTDPTWAAWLLPLPPNSDEARQVEVISWPYDDGGVGQFKIVVNVRLIPGDPTTMVKVDIDMLEKGLPE